MSRLEVPFREKDTNYSPNYSVDVDSEQDIKSIINDQPNNKLNNSP